MNKQSKLHHDFFMGICIDLALKAKAKGENPVGSLVVQNGTVIAKGIEANKRKKDITFHAEIIAIRAAIRRLSSQDLSGCFLYSTHEPCMMCSYVIRHCKIGTVIFGARTGAKGGYNSNYPILQAGDIDGWNSPPVIIAGILEKECLILKT